MKRSDFVKRWEKNNRIAQEIHNKRGQLNSPVKAWTVLAVFAGVYPAARVTLVQIPLGRQTESATYVASTVRQPRPCPSVL